MYEIELKTIRFSSGKTHLFDGEIAEILDFEESIVVRLASSFSSAVKNIFALDYRGNLLWTVPTPRSFSPQNPYVSLFRHGSYVEALSWEGHILTLHPKQGMIISEGTYSGMGVSKHIPSVRRWI